MMAAGRYFSSGNIDQKTIAAIASTARTAVIPQNPRPTAAGCALFSTKRKLSPQSYYKRRKDRAHRLNGLLRASVGGPCKLAHQPIDVRDGAADADGVGPGVERGAHVGRRANPAFADHERLQARERTYAVERRQRLPGGLGRIAAQRRRNGVGAAANRGDGVAGGS